MFLKMNRESGVSTTMVNQIINEVVIRTAIVTKTVRCDRNKRGLLRFRTHRAPHIKRRLTVFLFCVAALYTQALSTKL